jgi:arylsulfatase A-like enzyme
VPLQAATRGVVWRALDALGGAEVKAPRAVPGYRALLGGRTMVSRNPYAAHPPPRDRLDLLVTRLADVKRRAFDQRHALYLPPPATVRFRVAVPEAAVLRLALGGHLARVRIEAEGQTLLDRRVPQRGWDSVDLDLAPFAGRTVSLAFAAAGTGHAFLADPHIVAARPEAPSVLVILVDTLATWAVGCYGQRLPITPNFDRLCREGTTFDQAIANANWTRPSLVSMLSSWLPGKVGISYNQFFGLDIAPERARFYARRPDLLPLQLRRGGWRAAAIVNNLFLQGYHKYGVDLGFDRVLDYRRHVEDTVDITDAAIAFLERHRDERFFLLLNYNAPHVHYVPPARFAREVQGLARGRLASRTTAYLGEVRYTDEEVGRLLGALERLRLGRRTLVVLTADHGEVHDPRHAYRVVRTGRWSRFGHAVSMYDEEVRVPLVLRWPGSVPAGKRVSAQVRLIDLAPTLLDALGLPASSKHQGRSFLNLVRGEPDAEERIAFIEGRMMRAVRMGGFKYFWRLPGYEAIARGGRVERVPEELYDLRRDPREHRNLAGDPAQGERLARLREVGRRIQETDAVPDALARAPGAAPASPAPGTTRVHLRVVGDGTPRRFEGRLSAPGGVRRFRLFAHEAMDAVWREPDGTLRFRFEVARGPDALWAEVAAAGEIRLDLTMDGRPAPLRVGPYGLPLLGAGRIAGEDLSLLDAPAPPPLRPGRERGAFLWRDPPARTAAPETPPAEADEGTRVGGAAEREVEGILRDWGYIQGGPRGPRGPRRKR